MKCVISWAKTMGLPAYSSARAAVDMTVDVEGPPEVIVSEIRRAFDLVKAEVARQLDQLVVEPAEPEPTDLGWVHNAPAVPVGRNGNGPDRDRQPSQARPPSEPEPARPATQQQQQEPYRNGTRTERYDGQVIERGTPGGKGHDGFPRSGRELVPWAKKREESGQFPNLWKRLVGYGVAQDFPGRVVEWSRDEVTEAVRAVLGEGHDDEPDPEPPPARNGNGTGRNGYTNGYHR